MATKLKNLRVHEVSLVKRPANPAAQVLLAKSDDGEGAWEPCEDCPSPKTCKANGGCAAEVRRRGRAALRRAGERATTELRKSLTPFARHDEGAAEQAAERAAALAKSDHHPLLRATAARAAELLSLRRGR